MYRHKHSRLFALQVICLCLAGGVDNAYPQQEQQYANIAAEKSNGRISAPAINSNFPASAMIDGDRTGQDWGSGGGWNDNSQGVYPDIARLDFILPRAISKIDIFTLQDDFRNGVDPRTVPDLKFRYYGIVDFDVEYLDANNLWQLVQLKNGQDGRIRGNDLVWRSLELASEVTTRGVRVTVWKGKSPQPSDFSRIVEIEVMSRAITMTLSNPASSANDNFRISVAGYSVFHEPPSFHVYSLTNLGGAKWGMGDTLNTYDDRIEGFYGRFGGPGGLCGIDRDPADWDPRCSTDALGYFWKRTTCTGAPGEPCQNNELWNAWPGAIVDKFPSPRNEPIWPRINNWTLPNFQWIINHSKINQAIPNAPLTGSEMKCNPHNPTAKSTGAANAKVVQHKYLDNTVRWFMAFNSQIHTENMGPTDNWRVLWATSPDGKNWQVHDQVLFRNSIEALSCGNGFLVTDMFIDDGYFYVLMASVGPSYTYLVRSRIDQDSSSAKGFTDWYVAAKPLSAGRQYTWKKIPTGQQLDFGPQGYNAFEVMHTPYPESSFLVKQASATRVFSSYTPHSPSRYIAVTVDKKAGGDPEVQLWSTHDLSIPFSLESRVSGVSSGPYGFGYEFGFTHYLNNGPASPKIVKSGFHFWFTEATQVPEFDDPNNQSDAWEIGLLTRRGAVVDGF